MPRAGKMSNHTVKQRQDKLRLENSLRWRAIDDVDVYTRSNQLVPNTTLLITTCVLFKTQDVKHKNEEPPYPRFQVGYPNFFKGTVPGRVSFRGQG